MEATAESAETVGRNHIIERPRLTRLLDQTHARVIMLVAPAGYGKTTLARQWFAGKPHAWYGVTAASADVAALILGLGQAVSLEGESQSNLLRERLRTMRDPEQDVARLVDLFASYFGEELEDQWIVLDDYQSLMESRAAEDLVAGIIRRTSTRVFLTSRLRPSWAEARRILYGEVYELGQSPLALSQDEEET